MVVNGKLYPFNHPFMQAVTMFIGEALMILLFLGYIYNNKEKYQAECMEAENKKLSNSKKKYLWLLVPASFDFMTSTLQYIALTMIAPSIY